VPGRTCRDTVKGFPFCFSYVAMFVGLRLRRLREKMMEERMDLRGRAER